ncbi:MAG: hypothetical protein ACRDBO_09520 [Lachnospiraceae bacterium]
MRSFIGTGGKDLRLIKPVGVNEIDKVQLQITDRPKNNIQPSCLGLFDVCIEELEKVHICFFDQKNWSEIRAELLLIEEWILINRCKEDDDLRLWYCQRFENIISEVDEHFASDDRRLWIG